MNIGQAITSQPNSQPKATPAPEKTPHQKVNKQHLVQGLKKRFKNEK